MKIILIFYNIKIKMFDSDIYRRHIIKTFDDNNFPNLLIKHNAVIAGGNVLSVYTGFNSNDTDIYINERYFNNFLDNLLKNKKIKLLDRKNIAYYMDLCILAQDYDKSFFRKNGIKFKIKGVISNGSNSSQFDIMIIHDDRKIEDVVNNFDLSFCEIYYDGKNIITNHEKDIKEKKGFLRKDYMKSLLEEKNVFLEKRIRKYNERGFKININCNNNKINLNYELKKNIPKSKNILNEDKWYIIKILELFIFSINYHFIVKNWYKTYIRKEYIYKIPIITDNYNISFKPKSISDLELMKGDYKKDINLQNKFLAYIYKFLNSFKKFSLMELQINLKLYFGLGNNVIYELTKQYINDYVGNNITLKTMEKKLEMFKKNQEPDIFKKFIKKFKSEFVINTYGFIDSFHYNFEDKNIKGYDIYEIEYYNLFNYISKENNIAIVTIDKKEKEEYKILNINLYSIETIKSIIMDYRDNIFYECRSASMLSINKEDPIIKIPTLSGNIFILLWEALQILKFYKKNYKIFLIEKSSMKINYSASHKNVFNDKPDYVSAYHCQEGSNLDIYNLYRLSSKVNHISETSSSKFSDSKSSSEIKSLKLKPKSKVSKKAKSLDVENSKEKKSMKTV
jgi:hypothetical protein